MPEKSSPPDGAPVTRRGPSSLGSRVRQLVRWLLVLGFGIPLAVYEVGKLRDIGLVSGATIQAMVVIVPFTFGSIQLVRSRDFVRGMFWFFAMLLVIVTLYPLTSGGF